VSPAERGPGITWNPKVQSSYNSQLNLTVAAPGGELN